MLDRQFSNSIGKKVYLYEWTSYSELIRAALDQEGISIAGIVDSFESNLGWNRMNLLTELPEQALLPYDPDSRVIIISKYSREMRSRLQRLGYGEDQTIEVPVASDPSYSKGLSKTSFEEELNSV